LLKIDKPLDAGSVKLPHLKRGGLDLIPGEASLTVGFGGWLKDEVDRQWDIGKKRAGMLSFLGRETRSFDSVAYSSLEYGPGPEGAMTCDGDGGSPLFVKRGGVPFLAGIFASFEATDDSSQEQRCITATKATYVPISDVIAWIDQKLKAGDPAYQVENKIFMKAKVSMRSATGIVLNTIEQFDAPFDPGINPHDGTLSLNITEATKVFGKPEPQSTVTLSAAAQGGANLNVLALIVDGYIPSDQVVKNPCDGSLIRVPSTEVPTL
jgi:hypothetical protein